jgi:hypothetical protein
MMTKGNISEQFTICKIWGFHGGEYEEWRLLVCYAVRLLYEPTFRRNLALSSSETSVLTRTTRHNIAEDAILQFTVCCDTIFYIKVWVSSEPRHNSCWSQNSADSPTFWGNSTTTLPSKEQKPAYLSQLMRFLALSAMSLLSTPCHTAEWSSCPLLHKTVATTVSETWVWNPREDGIQYSTFLWNCKIWGCHGGDYEEWCLLGCNAVYLL